MNKLSKYQEACHEVKILCDTKQKKDWQFEFVWWSWCAVIAAIAIVVIYCVMYLICFYHVIVADLVTIFVGGGVGTWFTVDRAKKEMRKRKEEIIIGEISSLIHQLEDKEKLKLICNVFSIPEGIDLIKELKDMKESGLIQSIAHGILKQCDFCTTEIQRKS